MVPCTWDRYFLPLVLSFIVLNRPAFIEGHGRLIEPPSRASAWRYGFKTPPNYNDHELYCGGYNRQHQTNSGKCGICGDPYDLPIPRPHELGGIYGQGIIVRRYNPSSVIIIRVELTANHFGHFEFRLCENYKNTTQQCFDRHILRLASNYNTRFNGKSIADDPNAYKFYPRDGNKIYELRYRLPNISCAHCVLQWTYIAGNNWGSCPNGTEAVGCGPQETFRACSDITIGKEHITYISNELPNNSEENEVITTPTTTIILDEHYHKYDGLKTLIVVGLSLFVVLLIIVIIYTYYYQLGRRIKGWLKFGNKEKTIHGIGLPLPPKEPAPIPPPRVRRNSSSVIPTMQTQYNIHNTLKGNNKIYNVNLGNESLA